MRGIGSLRTVVANAGCHLVTDGKRNASTVEGMPPSE